MKGPGDCYRKYSVKLYEEALTCDLVTTMD